MCWCWGFDRIESASGSLLVLLGLLIVVEELLSRGERRAGCDTGEMAVARGGDRGEGEAALRMEEDRVEGVEVREIIGACVVG